MSFPEVLQALDETILREARGTPHGLVPLFLGATVVGGGFGMVSFIPYLVRRATRRLTLWLLLTVTVTSGLVSSLKAIVGRIRPCDALRWCSPIAVASPGGGSFPSGHAAGSFAFATFVAMVAPRFRLLVFAYALVVAWSRCFLGVHYPSDVAAGAVLGSLVGVLFARIARRRGSLPS